MFCGQIVREAVLLHRSTSDFYVYCCDLVRLTSACDVLLSSHDALSPSVSLIQLLPVLACCLNAECRYSALCSYIYLSDVSRD